MRILMGFKHMTDDRNVCVCARVCMCECVCVSACVCPHTRVSQFRTLQLQDETGHRCLLLSAIKKTLLLEGKFCVCG